MTTTAMGSSLPLPGATRRLEGKVALITGGNSGIGLTTAEAFLKEGASVTITGRDQATLASAAAQLREWAGPGQLIAAQSDVTVAADRARIMEQIAIQHGLLDVDFANAGIGEFFTNDRANEK